MARTWGRKGRPFRRAQAQCYAEETHCYFGDGYVDQTLANYRGSRARSVHHLIPPDIAPELANDRANMRLAHLGCNAKYGRGAYRGPTAAATHGPRGRRTGVGVRRGRGPVLEGAGRVGVTNPERDW
jgi:hypothetical protein